MLAHERGHIRRGDHVVKPLAFLLLTVHWFNPVLWAAYVLLGRDMENACDERVLRGVDGAGRAAYSRALVACAVRQRPAAVCPLAFGEVAVQERVKNAMNGKKPAVWAAVLLLIAAAVIGVCFLDQSPAAAACRRRRLGRGDAVRSADALRRRQQRCGRHHQRHRAGSAGRGYLG